MGVGAWVALVIGLGVGAGAATYYFMTHAPDPASGCDCPAPDVCTIEGTDGICPTGYAPDPENPGCCYGLTHPN